MTAPRQAPSSAAVLLDAATLSQLVGRPVRATRLRHKPGLSTTAALLRTEPDRQAPAVAGWVQAVHGAHLDKARNAVRRATLRGRSVHLVQVRVPGQDDLWLVHGPVTADPRLHRALDRLPGGPRDAHLAGVDSGAPVLRYNPMRRLVLRTTAPDGSAAVLRLTARRVTRWGPVLGELHTVHGVPVVPPLAGPQVPSSSRATLWPWVGDGDLSTRPQDEASARLAGAALAALHRAPVRLGRRSHAPAELHRRMAATAGDLALLDGPLGARAEGIADRVAAALRSGASTPALVHGDFSADQVAVGDDRVWLLDPDRIGVGAPEQDLGEFAAVELVEGRAGSGLLPALLEGYAAAGGGAPAAERLAPWVARSLLGRATEPFRAGEPHWRALVVARLDQAAEVLAEGLPAAGARPPLARLGGAR